MVIVGRWIGDFARQACDRVHQVGTRHKADKLLATHYRQALHAIGLHRIDDLLEGCVFGDGNRIAGHDIADPAAVLVNVIDGGVAEQNLEPAAALALGGDLGPADEVTLRDDPNELAGAIENGSPLT
jgi:hypothetical protein